MLYNLIIAPIEFIVDWVFRMCLNKVGTESVIYCVVVVSIVINILALPLYNIADALQEKERNLVKSLEFRVKRIKKAFKGDEQFMMLSEYYRQNNYHPLYALRSSLSILIEIPFFIAAYHYLSNCDALLGSKFWIFKDLGGPDALFKFSVGTKLIIINILPIIMTLINFVSGAVYTKEAPVKEKVQLYAVACIFLVLLYNSPSGLVIYWILNNLFSLAKNVVLKTKKPGAILFGFIAFCLTFLSIFFWAKHPETATWKKSLLSLLTLFFCCLPLLKKFADKSALNKKFTQLLDLKPSLTNTLTFVFSSLCLALFLGLILTTNVLSSSPIEFCNLGSTPTPLPYITTSIFFFLGFCFLWPFAIYKLFGNRTKNILCFMFPALLVMTVCNVYLFKADYGTLNSMFLMTDSGVLYLVPLAFSFLSLVIFAVIFTCGIFIKRTKVSPVFNTFLVAILAAETFFGIYKTDYINKTAKKYLSSIDPNKITSKEDIKPIYHLSKTGKNVIVIFLDRAEGFYMPYALKQFPEFAEKLQGFTYYPNTISFGTRTINGYTPLVGGYEYTPDNMNKRKDELLKDKHNEALLVMPKLFLDAGFSATVTDPAYANYMWKGDLTPYKQFPEIAASEEAGKYTDVYMKEKNIDNPFERTSDLICSRQIKNFSILQALIPQLRATFYNTTKPNEITSTRNFFNQFSTLYYLSNLTDFSNNKNSFIYIGNDTVHEPMILDYENFELPSDFDSKSIGGNTELRKRADYYHPFIAAMKQLTKYFDYLRENDIYDNTRIIVIADHGQGLDNKIFTDFSDPAAPARFNPLLLVKDFDSKEELKTDNSFMTNADTLFLAKKDLPVSNTNPFTGKEFIQDKENGCNVSIPPQFNTAYIIKRTQFPKPREAYHVKDNIFDPANWSKLDTTGDAK
ncbi:MAG: YidC/Oxa1 family membrane protein insertase [Treponema sp.]|uniref:YidC/Oxa1 family membrane protein insertase n=1 Tax=Treponema sp. TaxID=166 RepID=UPI00298EA13F|nr:YidC/Oxa1 family membrane protein insertase [Treponema sp.]MCR5386867.1 YidC/Oxa1 family membrane protein insertase [Treponema sp.]